MHPKTGQTRIFNQFVLFVLPLVISAVVLTSAVLMWTNYYYFRATVTRDYTNIIKVSSGEIRLFVQNAVNNLEALAWVLATGRPGLYDQEMALVAFRQINVAFESVSAVAPGGNIVASTRLNDADTWVPDLSLLERTFAERFVFSDIRFMADGLPLISVAVPFPTYAKEKLVIWGELNLKYVWEVLEGIEIGETGHIFLADTKGKLIAHRYMDRVLTEQLSLPKDFLADIRELHRPVPWFEKRPTGSVYYLGAYIPEMDWIVVLCQPTREIYHFMAHNVTWAVVITLIVCLVAVLLGWYAIKSFTRPIETMHEQVQRISAGDLEHQVAVTSGNEIGELGKAFNEMAGSLGKMLDREVRTAKELAHAKNLATLGVTAGKVTHEVGNLLNNVCMSANALRGESLSHNGRDALSKMENESARVSEFIKNFLKFAKPPKMQPAPVALHLIVREVLAMHEPSAREKKISIVLDWPEENPRVPADARLIYQVFTNLIKNATEAMADGGHIRVAGEVEDDFLRVVVEDTGAGIDPEDLERVFEPFFTTKGKKGTGLGMAIVQSTITAHRGTITCESEQGNGTRFVIRLPLM